MPELPEVETVRRGLEPVLVGNAFARVEQRRADLRFPLPENFGKRLSGRRIEALDRRAKYLLARLDDGEVLVMHLGMTGRFSIDHANGAERRGAGAKQSAEARAYRVSSRRRHCGPLLRCAALRLMDLIRSERLDMHALFKGLGIEPLSSGFTPEWLAGRLKGKATSIKAALLDQRLIAGLGNIYVCEALSSRRHLADQACGHARHEIGQADQED